MSQRTCTAFNRKTPCTRPTFNYCYLTVSPRDIGMSRAAAASSNSSIRLRLSKSAWQKIKSTSLACRCRSVCQKRTTTKRSQLCTRTATPVEARPIVATSCWQLKSTSRSSRSDGLHKKASIRSRLRLPQVNHLSKEQEFPMNKSKRSILTPTIVWLDLRDFTEVANYTALVSSCSTRLAQS